ncbi:MAG: hypothetical protein RJA22_1624 [Verrucomicrobiota bacterium]|jgi:type III pantothenate kinase
MILLLDIGNTHTHLGLADAGGVRRQGQVATRGWRDGRAEAAVRRFAGRARVEGAAVCSVVPWATPRAERVLRRVWRVAPYRLTAASLVGLGVRYPRPETIGPDRLANAVAARLLYGAPSVVIDFGTAVTFDVVDRRGDYVGGIIAPGLAVMTDYLHEKTALLPRIRIREEKGVIGRNTEQAMRIGAVHGYRGLIRELLGRLRRELGARRLRVVATGGYARLMAAGLPEIAEVRPALTLEGLHLAWRQACAGAAGRPGPAAK